jgi:flagellar biosynthesis protein
MNMAHQPSEGREEPRSAAVLAYRTGDQAPRLVAKGRGLMADEIIRRAREAGIYVHQSREMVSLLMQIDLDRRIPQQLYVAVAELLAWLHRIESGQRAVAQAPAKG